MLATVVVYARCSHDHNTRLGPHRTACPAQFRFYQSRQGRQLLLRYSGLDIDEEKPRQIVGVVGGVKQYGAQEKDEPFIHLSYLQQSQVLPGERVESRQHQTLVLRTAPELARGAGDLTAAVQHGVAGLDPDQSVTNVTSMQDVMVASIVPPET